MISSKIKELRLVVADECPYSCLYCNLYYKKLLDAKKISQSDFDNQYRIGNESYSLLYKKNKDDVIFGPSDYKFLFSILRKNFGLEDITFSGGDPFLTKNLKEIINLASKEGFRTTAITKGAPLFNIKNKIDARKKFGNLSRIIFSVDSLDPVKHAKNNLPLVKRELALKYLPKALKTIKTLTGLGYNIEVNSVIEPVGSIGKSLTKSFNKIRDIINFCLENGVSKVKFIELDSMVTMGKPYIEKYFFEMIKAGYFANNNISPWSGKKNEKITYKSITEIFSIPRKKGANMKVMAYRTHCPSCHINKNKVKDCEFSQGGELHLDFSGKSFLCQKDADFKFVDISQAVKNRDSAATIKGLLLIEKGIMKQKCKK
ncbi:MAG: radical SAM protein [Candidatus Falkowbacteria bacterium]